MNLGPDGADRPLTLTLLQLRTSAAFEGLDFFALQAPETTLGADLVSATQVAIAPGGSASTVIELDPATTVIGIVGGFRDPAGKVFRISAPVTPGTSSTLSVAVTGSGVALQSA
jgi:type VI secretion system protein VasD